MKRLKLTQLGAGWSVRYGVACREYTCNTTCQLFKIIGGYPKDKLYRIENRRASYGNCAVALVYAEFFGLY